MRLKLPATLRRTAIVSALLGMGLHAASALAQETAEPAPETAPAASEPESGAAPAAASTETEAPPAGAETPTPAASAPATIPVQALQPAEESLPPADKHSTRLDAIVVTANKREQLLQDVPMSMTAIQGKDLEKMGAKTFTDYAQTIPGLNFGSYGEGRSRINIRGLQGVTGVATVAYLVDGIAQGDSPPDAELFDINRIEVLRGPQGTLYGEGAVGGAIKIVTNNANPDVLLSKALGSISSNAAGALQHDLNGMVNLPLIDGALGLRLVGFSRHADGYITVREPDFTNPPGLKSYSSETILATNANTTDVTGGRFSLDWKATDELGISAKYSSQNSNAAYGPAESPILEERYGLYNVTRGTNPLVGDFTRHNYRQSSINVNWELPWASFESVTGMADVKEDLLTGVFVVLPDSLGSVQTPVTDIPLPIIRIPDTGIPGVPSGNSVADMFDFRLINQYSYLLQELRLSSISDGNWNWTSGLFYKLLTREAYAEVTGGPNFGSVLDSLINLHFSTEEYAVYGQAEYSFSEALSVLLGARYYRADLANSAVGAGGDDDGVLFTPSYSDVSPKLTLSYHWNDHVLLYSTAAKGFRAGGVNFSEVSPPPENMPRFYDPDVLWSYELGINSSLFDGGMTANAAVFTSNWNNLQQELRVRNSNGQGQRVVINAGSAHSRGIEMETTMALPMDLTWTIGGAFIDAAIDKDVPNPDIEGGVIAAGTPLENQPRLSGSSSLTHNHRFDGGWGLSSGLLWTYRGKTHADILNPARSISKPYQLLNLRFGLKGSDEVWDADLFVNNLLNKRASSFTFQHTDTDLPLPRRTIGMRLNYNF